MPPGLHIGRARIWTGDFARPWADSMTIDRAGRIAAVGDDLAPPAGIPAIDAQGRMLSPGLIDSHMHLLMGGRSLGEVDLSKARSRGEFEALVAAAATRLKPGEWLIGRGWHEHNWPGHALPDRIWLAAAGNRPCVCSRMDVHAILVNDAVLAMINADTRDDPPGGRILRDSSGAATGLLQESAAWSLVNPLVPAPDMARKRQHLLAAQAHAHALGLTAVGSMECLADVEDAFAPLAHELTLRCHITLLDRDWPVDVSMASRIAPSDQLRIIGFKTFIDGTLGSRTARMLADYSDASGGADNRGMLVELAAEDMLRDWINLVAASGLSPSMHAIGDEAARLALDAIDSLPADLERVARPRIEHAQQLDPADIVRFGDRGKGRGRIASMQPLHKADDGRFAERRVGHQRLAGTFAFRSLHDAGAILAFGSDWPVVSCDPIMGMRAAITGRTLDDQPFLTDQNLTVEQALLAYTRDAAHCLGMKDAGVLRVGNRGDCVMYDVDPFTANWHSRPPRVCTTIAAGRVVFNAET